MELRGPSRSLSVGEEHEAVEYNLFISGVCVNAVRLLILVHFQPHLLIQLQRENPSSCQNLPLQQHNGNSI